MGLCYEHQIIWEVFFMKEKRLLIALLCLASVLLFVGVMPIHGEAEIYDAALSNFPRLASRTRCASARLLQSDTNGVALSSTASRTKSFNA